MKRYCICNAIGFGIFASVFTALFVYVIMQPLRPDVFGWIILSCMALAALFLWSGAIMHGYHSFMVCKYGDAWMYGEHESQRREAGR